jgi:hypothetical protein
MSINILTLRFSLFFLSKFQLMKKHMFRNCANISKKLPHDVPRVSIWLTLETSYQGQI